MVNKKLAQKRLQLFVVVALFALVGSYAATATVATEPEQGTVNFPAKILQDSSASNDTVVVFGPKVSTTLHSTVRLMPLGDSITNGLGYS